MSELGVMSDFVELGDGFGFDSRLFGCSVNSTCVLHELSEAEDRFAALLAECREVGFNRDLVEGLIEAFGPLRARERDFWRWRVFAAFVWSVSDGLVDSDVSEVAGLISVLECL